MAELTLVDRLMRQLERYQTSATAFVREVLGVEPSDQQRSLLDAVSKPGARVSVKSGHGTGKTTALAWLVLWHVSVFPDSKVPCTAPTGHQLKDLLWAEISKWHSKMDPWWASQLLLKADTLCVRGNPDGQFAVARTSRKENPEALQGFHATHVLYIVDEASGVPDVIFEPMRGALSTAGSRCVLAANPTRLDGLFYRTHHRLSSGWTTLQFSGLDSPMVSPAYIEEMRLDYGEDSDMYRVRVLGDFPRSAINQLIGADLVDPARGRYLIPHQFDFSPVVLGVDVAWEGDDRSCIWKRQGLYAELLGVWTGVDNMTLADYVLQAEDRHNADATFIDVGWGTGVIDRLRQLGRRPVPVNFGGSALRVDRYQNKRAEMWCEMKDWLASGGAIPDSDEIADDLFAVQYFQTTGGKLQLESKKDIKRRGLPSPDLGDGLALTFALPVTPGTARPQRANNNYKAI